MRRAIASVCGVLLSAAASVAAQDPDSTRLQAGTWLCETEEHALRAAEMLARQDTLPLLEGVLPCGRLREDTEVRATATASPSVVRIQGVDPGAPILYLPVYPRAGALAVDFPGPPRPRADPQYEGRYQGTIRGRDAPTGVWFAVGFLGGFWFPLVGNGLAFALAGSNEASPVVVPPEELFPYRDRGMDFEDGFRRGYREAVLSKRQRSALVGGLTGTAAVVALIVLLVATE